VLGERLATSPLLARLLPAEDSARAAGVEAWVVGGAVRDLLLGATSFADVDLAAQCDTFAFGRALADALGGSFVELDAERGTARVVESEVVIDITRLETTIAEDLARRDLTINAMAFPLAAVRDPAAAELLDPFGGEADLASRTIRLVAERALTDDPLRLLRVYRFAAALDATVTPDTIAAVRRHAALIARPAPERVARELFLLLDTPDAVTYVRAMDDAGLLGRVLPELEAMRGVTQNEYHHLDVLGHSLETLDCLEDAMSDLPAILGETAPRFEAFLAEDLAAERPRRALLKFAALLHDTGKPAAKSTKGGRVIFYTHNVLGAEIARKTCERLRLSSRETDEAERYVYRHMIPGDFEAGGTIDERREMRFFRKYGEQGLALVLLSLADGSATRGPKADPDRSERFRRFFRRLAQDYYAWIGRRLESPPLVNGHDLIAELGMQPGVELGRILKRIRHRQLVGAVKTREEALELARRERDRLAARTDTRA